MLKINPQILPVIVFAQFCCTSLWFAGNAVMPDLIANFDLPETALGHLTSAVQFGFIAGTLLFAFLTISDRYSPSRIFFACALIGAAFNLGILYQNNSFTSLLILRFLTGFSLAGIYPVGMKIASDYFKEGLGRSLGFLVGALVLGTAFPHFLNEFTGSGSIDWRYVMAATSLLATIGGLLILICIPDGPYRTKKSKPDLSLAANIFRNKKFKNAAFGYFGHMWELYTFWAFVPVILSFYKLKHTSVDFSIPLISFIIIGSGGLACVLGGFLSEKFGVKKIASISLMLSGFCCLFSPLIIIYATPFALISFLIFWGMVVVADSPLFSTLVAQNSPAESRGTALTIVNSIGFLITIFSIQLISYLSGILSLQYLFLILAAGPAFGLTSLFLKRTS